MSKKINGFSEVLAIQPTRALSLCRIKDGDLDSDRQSRQKNRHGGSKQKYQKACNRTRFRTARQAREALLGAFAGLEHQAGDALHGAHLANLVICCDVCRGYHLASPSEWFESQVAYAA